MQQSYASGRLINLLAATAAGADKSFFNIRFIYTQCRHALDEQGQLLGAHGKVVHKLSVASGALPRNA